VVNVYSTSTITESVESSVKNGSISSAAPKPIRDLMNLTTAPTTIAFNHDSQMMVTASNKKKDALKVVSRVVVYVFLGERVLIFSLPAVSPTLRNRIQQLANVFDSSGCGD
jgi:hypothetical protein